MASRASLPCCPDTNSNTAGRVGRPQFRSLLHRTSVLTSGSCPSTTSRSMRDSVTLSKASRAELAVVASRPADRSVAMTTLPTAGSAETTIASPTPTAFVLLGGAPRVPNRSQLAANSRNRSQSRSERTSLKPSPKSRARTGIRVLCTPTRKVAANHWPSQIACC